MLLNFLIRYFNSTIVRLKHEYRAHVNQARSYFNSTIVRLKLNIHSILTHTPTIFQFYNSSIKTFSKVTLGFCIWHFNSTIVRLKPIILIWLYWGNLNFNSTIVRLKRRWHWIWRQLVYYFNSTIVRLKLQN